MNHKTQLFAWKTCSAMARQAGLPSMALQSVSLKYFVTVSYGENTQVIFNDLGSVNCRLVSV